MRNAYISGTGGFVPPRVVTNDDLVRDYGIDSSNEWILKRTGIRERRFAEPGVASVELAVPACQEAMARAGITKDDVDMILYCTLSPRHVFPGDGVHLQTALGMTGEGSRFVPAMDIRNQCSGFVYGLATAAGLVRGGGLQHVLLVGAETHSAALDLSTRGRTVATLFGDGAGAVVVSATDEDRGIRAFTLGADGRHADILCQKVWDMRRRPFLPVNEEGVGQVEPGMMWAYMEGQAVFKNAVERMVESLLKVCWQHGVTELSQIDFFAFHQANLRINQMVAKMLKIPEEKLLTNIDRYGNTTAATIPLLLADAAREGRLQPGSRVACVAFGSGFTWGAALVDW